MDSNYDLDEITNGGGKGWKSDETVAGISGNDGYERESRASVE
jgi:hypothetical protein